MPPESNIWKKYLSLAHLRDFFRWSRNDQNNSKIVKFCSKTFQNAANCAQSANTSYPTYIQTSNGPGPPGTGTNIEDFTESSYVVQNTDPTHQRVSTKHCSSLSNPMSNPQTKISKISKSFEYFEKTRLSLIFQRTEINGCHMSCDIDDTILGVSSVSLNVFYVE